MVVLPVATPVTRPVLSTVATDSLSLVQLPPEVASLSCVVLPAATLPDPVMAATLGALLRVTVTSSLFVDSQPLTVCDA